MIGSNAGSGFTHRRTAALLALALVLVQLHACSAQASVMDKDGDGVVTPEEFVEHAQAQEVVSNVISCLL
jgi:hypothetical protein